MFITSILLKIDVNYGTNCFFLPNLSLMVRRMAWWSRGSVLKLFMINKASTFNVLIS